MVRYSLVLKVPLSTNQQTFTTVTVALQQSYST